MVHCYCFAILVKVFKFKIKLYNFRSIYFFSNIILIPIIMSTSLLI